MMNYKKGYGTKWLWPNFKVPSLHSPGGTEEIHQTPSGFRNIRESNFAVQGLPLFFVFSWSEVQIFARRPD